MTTHPIMKRMDAIERVEIRITVAETVTTKEEVDLQEAVELPNRAKITHQSTTIAHCKFFIYPKSSFT